MFCFLNRLHVIILLRTVSSKFRLLHVHMNMHMNMHVHIYKKTKGEVPLDFKLLKRARQTELWLE